MKRGKTSLIAILLILVLTAALFPSTAFAQTATLQGKAQALKELGLFAGTNKGDELNRPPTRLESVVMLVRFLGKEAEAKNFSGTHPFNDVPNWGSGYVAYAYDKGLILGLSEGEFGSAVQVDGTAFLTLVLRALEYEGIPLRNALKIARVAGLLDQGTTLEPFTRGTAISICYNALNATLQNTGTTLADKLLAEGVFTAETLNSARRTALQPKQAKIELVKDYSFYAPTGSQEKVVYLTFDDGPSANVTPKILEILKEHDVKATFFMVGTAVDKNPDLVKRVYEEGHVIANHSYSHIYKNLYASKKNLAEDIQKAENSINAALGFDYGNQLFRFPGGSGGKSKELKNQVYSLGYQYVDWNALGNDAVSKKGATSQEIVKSVIDTSKNKKEVTLLFHDATTKSTTAEALPEVIRHFKSQGYVFRTLAE